MYVRPASGISVRQISLLTLWISEGLLEHSLHLRGWNSQAHGKFPGKFDSSNISKDNVSRGIGRKFANCRLIYFIVFAMMFGLCICSLLHTVTGGLRIVN